MQIPLSAGIRQNRSKRYMTVVWCILLAFLLSAGGCSLVKIEEGERTPLEYTVVDTAELPQSAQELIQEKKYGYMVAVKNNEITEVPLEEVAGKLKTVDPNCSMIQEAKMIGISFGDE